MENGRAWLIFSVIGALTGIAGVALKAVEIFYQEIQSAKLPAISTPTPIPHTETLLSGRYQDNDDGTVTDVQTGLQWMYCALG